MTLNQPVHEIITSAKKHLSKFEKNNGNIPQMKQENEILAKIVSGSFSFSGYNYYKS